MIWMICIYAELVADAVVMYTEEHLLERNWVFNYFCRNKMRMLMFA